MATTMATLGFIKPLELYDNEKPYWLFLAKPDHRPDVELTNVQLDVITGIPLHDVRGHEDSYSLEEHGFQFIKTNQTFQAFDSEQRIIDEYLPQVEKVIRENIPYAEKIHIYDWRIRKEATNKDPDLVSPNQIQDRSFPLAPSSTVHTDSTEYSLLKRVKAFLPGEADHLLEGRVQLINFWRPIHHVAQNWPLVVCDARTTSMDKLVAVDQVSRQFVADVYYAKYDPDYQWYFQSLMAPDEGVLFKSWDTAESVPARTCLHSSTPLPADSLAKDYEIRRSVECRALVFSKKD
ncbi:hypothetical protein J3F83DRAFT_722158 [Trichoderma novae-zelandiae]